MISTAAPGWRATTRARRVGRRVRLLGASSASRCLRASNATCQVSSIRPEIGFRCHTPVIRQCGRTAIRATLALPAGALPPRPIRAASAYFPNMTHHPRAHDARSIAAEEAAPLHAGENPRRCEPHCRRMRWRYEETGEEGIGAAGPQGASGSAGRRGDLPRGELCRARGVAVRARPAITRMTTAQLGKTSMTSKKRRGGYSNDRSG
jgi:hypothetical protein